MTAITLKTSQRNSHRTAPHQRRPLRRVSLLAALVCATAGLLSPAAQATTPCPNEQLRRESSPNPETQLPASMQLPDCRAYELVTPPFKDGAFSYLEDVSPDGTHAIISSEGNFGDAGNEQRLAGSVNYELTRTSTGWSETDLTPAATQFPNGELLQATPGLGETLWSLRSSSQSALAHDLYIRDADGVLHDIGPVGYPPATAGPPGLGGQTEEGIFRYARVDGSQTVAVSEPSLSYCSSSPCANAVFQGASEDGSKAFFTSTQEEEAPGVTDPTANLYEAELTETGGK
jgi:hypothetical protein